MTSAEITSSSTVVQVSLYGQARPVEAMNTEITSRVGNCIGMMSIIAVVSTKCLRLPCRILYISYIVCWEDYNEENQSESFPQLHCEPPTALTPEWRQQRLYEMVDELDLQLT